jgi:predicted alpha/beta hydrolase
VKRDVRNIYRPDGRKLAAMKFAPAGKRSSRLVSISFALGIRKSFY